MKNVILYFTVSLIIILILEIISNFIYVENDYDKITKILKEDSELIWVIRPYINTVFESNRLFTNSLGFRNSEIKEKQKNRIIIMGASPSFGWGVEKEKTYAYLLEEKLKDYEVINASVIGYSSYQGKILFEKKIKDLKPDMLIFAYGVNDPDRYRFFRNEDRPDKDLKPTPSYIIKLSNIIRKSKLLRLILNIAVEKGLSEYHINRSKRVNLDDFLENIDYFRNESVKSNFKLILLGFPFLKPPEYTKYSRCSENEIEIKKCLGIEKISAENFKKIQKLQLCKIYDDITEYNEEMKRYANKNSLHFIDLYNIFKDRYDLFLNPKKDMVHFSEKGHREISEILYREIKGYETKNTFSKSKL